MQICYIPYNGRDTLVNRAYNEIKGIKDAGKKKQVARLFSVGVVSLAMVGNTNASEKNIEEVIKRLGKRLVSGVQFAGFYIALAMCTFEVIKALLESDPKRIPSIVARFALGVAGLYAIPLILESVKDAFTIDLSEEAVKAASEAVSGK